MPAPLNVAVIIGSLRKQSFNRAMAHELSKLAPDSLALRIVEIDQLPLYNEDEEPRPPDSWVVFRRQIEVADALLFLTPEYNRSVPAALKNALDVSSRPYGHSVWDRKPGAVISVSVGALGGFGANHHLRQILVALNIPAMPQPEVYIGGAGALFDQSGHLTNQSTRALLGEFAHAFAGWASTYVDH